MIPVVIMGYNSDNYYVPLKGEQIIYLQVIKLIDSASQIFQRKYSEPLQKPNLILGDDWMKKPDYQTDEYTFHSFEIITGMLRLGTDRAGNIIIIQFFPRINVTESKLLLFLSRAYAIEIEQEQNQKNVEFVLQSGKYKYVVGNNETRGLLNLLIARLPDD
jgi:hypothetical protein